MLCDGEKGECKINRQRGDKQYLKYEPCSWMMLGQALKGELWQDENPASKKEW
jgi:hypothetical protein